MREYRCEHTQEDMVVEVLEELGSLEDLVDPVSLVDLDRLVVLDVRMVLVDLGVHHVLLVPQGHQVDLEVRLDRLDLGDQVDLWDRQDLEDREDPLNHQHQEDQVVEVEEVEQEEGVVVEEEEDVGDNKHGNMPEHNGHHNHHRKDVEWDFFVLLLQFS